MKTIVSKEITPSNHLLGQFLDESHYDVLVQDDCDLYTPANCDISVTVDCQPQTDCSTCPKGPNEDRVAFKFRKNYFSKQQQQDAYEGLRAAAQSTNNRGTAAGPRTGKAGNREWVTEFQEQVLAYFSKPHTTVTGEDPLVEILAHRDELSQPGSINTVWFASKKLDFDAWVKTTRKLPPEDQKKAAKEILDDYISHTTYANEVLSGIAGAFGRVPRMPYGRLASYNDKNPEGFAKSLPFLQQLDHGFKKLLPQRYGSQEKFTSTLDPHFVIPGTVFTTLTINKTFRTAAHLDAGDYGPGFSNLLVLSNDGNYTGGYLVLPELRVAIDVRPGDLLLIANHTAIHGNTPIVLGSESSERVSIVAYAREDLQNLGSWEYESLRRAFVEERSNNKEHPDWWGRWNGVSAGMWQTREWFEYVKGHLGVDETKKNDPEIWEMYGEEKIDLESFFG